jgi:ubiquinone/menaquinone biosynthesis C-methylase UbiE
MEDIAKRVRDVYDRIAIKYATVNKDMPLELVKLAQDIFRYLGTGAQIIDIGCGHGRDMAWFESRGMAVTGIDISFGMLSQARPLVRGRLFQMDMRHLAFPDAEFWMAWCCGSLLHIPKYEVTVVLKEIRRVLTHKGVLGLTVQEGKGEGWEDGYCNGVRRFFARYQRQEMEALLSNSGFFVQKISSSRLKTNTWLEFTCIAL